jgi:hypothetical protein
MAKQFWRRRQLLAEHRHAWKDFACNAVEGYMDTMAVSLEELIRHIEKRQQQMRRKREAALQRAPRGPPPSVIIPPQA